VAQEEPSGGDGRRGGGVRVRVGVRRRARREEGVKGQDEGARLAAQLSAKGGAQSKKSRTLWRVL